ncbi:cation transporter [Fibrobacterota bacterium]
MKNLKIFVVSSVWVCITVGALLAEIEKKKGKAEGNEVHSDGINQSPASKDIICPVSGEPANKEVFFDFKGNEEFPASRVYFCCKHCISAFQENPAKHFKNKNKKCLHHQHEDHKGEKVGTTSAETGTILVFEVFGMDCPGCHGGLNKLIENISGVKKSEANWKMQVVKISLQEGASVKNESILQAIRDANFTPGKRLQ